MSDIEKAVARAQVATKAFYDGGGWGSYEEVLSDLLADLMHYVDALESDREIGESFNDLLSRARMNYLAEVEEKES